MANNRRSFIKQMAGLSLASIAALKANDIPARLEGAKYMGNFIAPKLSKVKVAIIGLGARSGTHLSHLAYIPETEIVALSDVVTDRANRAKEIVIKHGGGKRHSNVKLYTKGPEDYKRLLKETKPDIVYIVTPWKWHAPMAIDAMNAGAHAFVEVPMATTIEDIWKMIDTSERTQKHCMMLENCNYGREELLYLNMVRKGLFGELLHAEAAYIHELRFQMENNDSTGSWRTYEYAARNGNLYPTHGLGPVAQYMNLARTDDNFQRLTSFSSPAKGRALYAKKKFPDGHKWRDLDFKGGDISTSIIKTALGRTIMVQWDETSPRPYSRHNLIQGTKGTATGYPTRIALDYEKGELPDAVFNAFARENAKHTNFHSWAQGDKLAAVYEAYDHPLYTRFKEDAAKMGGHGGMDFIMNARVIECLVKGQPLDQNVYEGAYWSAVGPLSEKSVTEDGMPQDFPDFTRGQWKTTPPLAIIS